MWNVNTVEKDVPPSQHPLADYVWDEDAEDLLEGQGLNDAFMAMEHQLDLLDIEDGEEGTTEDESNPFSANWPAFEGNVEDCWDSSSDEEDF